MSRKKLFYFTSITLIFIAFIIINFTTCYKYDKSFTQKENYLDNSCNRIISLAPSITEVLFKIGLGSNLAGVTSFASYPPEVNNIPAIGGYFNPDFEKIVSLKPDIILLLEEHGNIVKKLDMLEIPYLKVNHKTVNDVLYSMGKIGSRCGKISQAAKLTDKIQNKLSELHRKASSYDKKKVLISVGRKMGAGKISDVYIAGPDTFYDNLLTLLNARNAYRGNTVAYPKLQIEGIIALNPDYIIDIVAGNENVPDDTKLIDDWKTLSMITAVKNNNVFILRDDYTVIPGARIDQLAETLAYIIHPEIKKAAR